VASQSTSAEEGARAYVEGWQAISAAVDSGSSWSGHERNNAYLNLTGGRFVEVSSVLGLDHEDDGRGVVRVDWDGDGDLDLIQRARSAPQLRFLENRLGGRGITVELKGRAPNTSAVGADLTWVTQERSLRQEIRCGEGYLTQPSLRRTFGLQPGESLPTLMVKWPDGTPEPFHFAGTGTFLIERGTGVAVSWTKRRDLRVLESGPLPESKPPNRIVLRKPLPLSPELIELLLEDLDGRPVLLEAWSRTCAPCREELQDLVDARQSLADVGLRVQAICMDPLADGEGPTFALMAALQLEPADRLFSIRAPQDGASPALESLLGNILDKKELLGLPTSLLLDASGVIQVIYLGKVEPEVILTDVRLWALQRPQGAFRSHRAGRWFFGAPRNWTALASVLKELGFSSSATFYSER
jgi:hypothetical protein